MRLLVILVAFLSSSLAADQEFGNDILLGGWRKVEDLTSPLLQSVADEALKRSEEGGLFQKVVRVSRILGAWKQILFPPSYRLIVLVNKLDCTEDEWEYAPNRCSVESTSICLFEINAQPATKTYDLKSQLCFDFKPVDSESILDSLKGWVSVQADGETVQNYAAKAVNLYGASYQLDSILRSQIKITLDRCIEIKFELVIRSDSCYDEGHFGGSSNFCERLTCNLVLKVEFWTFVDSLVSKTCRAYDDPHNPTTPLPIDLLGGWFTLDLNSSETKSVIEKAVKLYETQSNFNVISYEPIGIRVQVVAGINYKIRLTITGCSTIVTNLCEVFTPCTFEVFSRPWTDTFILAASCQS